MVLLLEGFTYTSDRTVHDLLLTTLVLTVSSFHLLIIPVLFRVDQYLAQQVRIY